MIDINLLPSQIVLSPRERHLHRWLKVAGAVITGVVVALLGGLLLSHFYLQTTIRSLETQKATSLSHLESEKDLAVDLRTVKDKIQGIKAIRNSQIDLASRVTYMKSLLPPGSVLSSLTLGINGDVNFALKLADVGSLNTLVTNLTSRTAGGALNQITLSGLRLDSANTLSLTVNATYIP